MLAGRRFASVERRTVRTVAQGENMATRHNIRRVNFKAGILHVETPLGIVNIHAGPWLTDHRGRAVIAVEMIPDNYAGSPKVLVRGGRFIQCKRAKGGK